MLSPLQLTSDRITLGAVDVLDLAQEYGTPLYVYNLDTVGQKFDSLFENISWPKLKIFYAMKSNWNRDLLRFLEQKGAGIDAVSIGDILLAKKVGFPAERIIYTANNITDEEMDRAEKESVIINIGSLSRLQKFAERYPGNRVCIRFNPEVVAGEHDHVKTGGDLSKFGILMENAPRVREIADRYGLKVVGLHEHTGSGIADTESVLESMENLLSIAHHFPDLEFVDFGGGFKVPYSPAEKRINYESFGAKITSLFSEFCRKYGRELDMYFEPGKFLTAECGLLLVEVNTLKQNRQRRFAGVNSGFSQLIRPMCYGAYHHIVNLSNPRGAHISYDIVGNICETGDAFARGRMIEEIDEGHILAIQNAGSYCYSMASFYNMRPKPAEVVVESGEHRLSTKRVTYDQLVEQMG